MNTERAAEREAPYIELHSSECIDTSVFWLDPEKIGTVTALVNSAREATMILGVVSRQDDEFSDTRVKLKSALIDSSHPIADTLGRAFDVGFMYGSLIEKEETTGDVGVSWGMEEEGSLAERFTTAHEGLDLSQENDAFQWFMRLREAEVDLYGSDILAYALSRTQDHVRQIFDRPQELSVRQLVALQTSYYAGALAGAGCTRQPVQFTKPVEITRGMRSGGESVSARLEFDAHDPIIDSITYNVRHRLGFYPSFHPWDVHRKQQAPCIAVVPGGLQYGPNVASIPLFIPGVMEDAAELRADITSIDALLVQIPTEDPQGVTERIAVMDPLEYARSADNNTIRGIVVGNTCLGAIDEAHPDAQKISQFVQDTLGIKEKTFLYTTDCEEFVAAHREETSRKIRKKAATLGVVAALGSTWIPDIIGAITVEDYDVQWGMSAGINAGILTLVGLKTLSRRLSHKHKQEMARIDRHLQAYIDNATIYTTQAQITNGSVGAHAADTPTS